MIWNGSSLVLRYIRSMCLHDYFDQRKLAQRELHLYCYCCSILILTAWTKFMKISQQRCSRRIKYTTHMASRPSFPQLLKCVTCIFITPNYYILSYMSSYHFCNNLLKQVETGMSKLQEETHLFYQYIPPCFQAWTILLGCFVIAQQHCWNNGERYFCYNNAVHAR